jgi:hypothetical protein
MTTTNAIPEVYVLWHPSCDVGEFLAREVYGWLRPGNGQGPQVFYRSLPAPESAPEGLPPPLPGEARLHAPSLGTRPRGTDMQIVLVLIDEHLVADPAWRYWLAQLVAEKGAIKREFLPVALDSTAYNLISMRRVNFLRPAGLPLPAATSDKAVGDAARAVVRRSLLRQLTETMCRMLLSPAGSEAAVPPKVRIFLSHAKRDGTRPAKKIRDHIYAQTQLAAFYDENDIPMGSFFAETINTGLTANETAAMVVVRSAEYASRPWCRRELSQFRRPVREKLPSGEPTPRWCLNPTIVVDALEDGKQSAGIPELGNSTLIRWADSVADQEEQVVTTVLRDVLLSAFHASQARLIPELPNRVVINWLPDPTTLLRIPEVRLGQEVRIVHPGRGLSGLELDILSDFFMLPEDVQEKLEFRSFEEVLT